MKKPFALFLVGSLVASSSFCLYGCGKKDPTADQSTSNQTEILGQNTTRSNANELVLNSGKSIIIDTQNHNYGNNFDLEVYKCEMQECFATAYDLTWCLEETAPADYNDLTMDEVSLKEALFLWGYQKNEGFWDDYQEWRRLEHPTQGTIWFNSDKATYKVVDAVETLNAPSKYIGSMTGKLGAGDIVEGAQLSKDGNWVRFDIQGVTSYVRAEKLVKVDQPVEKKPDVITPVNKVMYATESLNIRSSYSTSASKVGKFTINSEVKVTGLGIVGTPAEGWAQVEFNGDTAFVIAKYLSDTKVPISTPNGGGSSKPSGGGGSSKPSKPSKPSGGNTGGNTGGGIWFPSDCDVGAGDQGIIEDTSKYHSPANDPDWDGTAGVTIK